jgi:hypothetical protein
MGLTCFVPSLIVRASAGSNKIDTTHTDRRPEAATEAGCNTLKKTIDVNGRDVQNMSPIKTRYQVPLELQSCRTANEMEK